VTSIDLAAHNRADLIAEVRQYRHQTALLGAVVGLLIAIVLVNIAYAYGSVIAELSS
jgi:hypothetical protein